jgi:putative heme-binding domain-containing protein
MRDFEAIQVSKDEHAIMRGMKSFLDVQCHQCHQMDGRGIELGPDLSKVSERFRGKDLLQQILKPSSHIDEPYKLVRLKLKRVKNGVGIW